jgi:hypothetical protein
MCTVCDKKCIRLAIHVLAQINSKALRLDRTDKRVETPIIGLEHSRDRLRPQVLRLVGALMSTVAGQVFV